MPKVLVFKGSRYHVIISGIFLGISWLKKIASRDGCFLLIAYCPPEDVIASWFCIALPSCCFVADFGSEEMGQNNSVDKISTSPQNIANTFRNLGTTHQFLNKNTLRVKMPFSEQLSEIQGILRATLGIALGEGRTWAIAVRGGSY